MSTNTKIKELEKAAVKANNTLASLQHITEGFTTSVALPLVNSKVIADCFKTVVTILESIQGSPQRPNGNGTTKPKAETKPAVSETKPAEPEPVKPSAETVKTEPVKAKSPNDISTKGKPEPETAPAKAPAKKGKGKAAAKPKVEEAEPASPDGALEGQEDLFPEGKGPESSESGEEKDLFA